ncbi:MAG: Gfo/Idh/MocA family oxidoreductase [Lentisphaeria bacterium]|nr:Gfo/Idh/MocA family oxidoreductase [Lentisphaeria bacterium]
MIDRKYHSIGIIGFGARGQLLAETIGAEIPEYGRLAAVADLRENPTFRQGVGIYCRDFKVYRDYRELLADDTIDTVIVETYPESHLEITAAAIRAGKAVMCDKPAVSTLAEAAEMYRVVTSTPCAFQMGLNMPCRPVLVKTAELLADGAIGRVFSVRGCCDVGYAFAHDVILRKFAGDPAGLVMGKLTHDTDFIQFALNTYAEEVCGFTANFQHRRHGSGETSDDTAVICGVLHNGTLFSQELTSCGSAYSRKFTFFGEKGELRVDSKERFLEIVTPAGECRRIEVAAVGGGHGGADKALLSSFLDYVDSGTGKARWPERICSSVMVPLAAMEHTVVRTGEWYRGIVGV